MKIRFTMILESDNSYLDPVSQKNLTDKEIKNDFFNELLNEFKLKFALGENENFRMTFYSMNEIID